MTQPKVSLGVPVYNGEKYLGEALESLVQQEYENFEIIISDNASTDGTETICRSYAARDKRIRYYRNETNLGSSPNYNRVFELARGEFFKWCAHDDRCLPGFLGRCVDVMNAAPASVALVYTQCDLIDENGKVTERAPDQLDIRSSRPHRRLAYVLRNVGYAHPLWGLHRVSCLRKTRLMVGCALCDHVLLSEVSLTGEIWEVPEVHFQLRMHPGNAWAICSQEQGTEAWKENTKATRKSRQALQAWHNAARANKKVWLPIREEIYWEQFKGVHHVPLGAVDKLLCYVTVPTACYGRRLRNLGGLWKRRLKASFLPANTPGNKSEGVVQQPLDRGTS